MLFCDIFLCCTKRACLFNRANLGKTANCKSLSNSEKKENWRDSLVLFAKSEVKLVREKGWRKKTAFSKSTTHISFPRMDIPVVGDETPITLKKLDAVASSPPCYVMRNKKKVIWGAESVAHSFSHIIFENAT